MEVNTIIISPVPHPSRYEHLSKTRAQGGGDGGSLMGCAVLFLPEEVEATDDGHGQRAAVVF